MLGKLSLDAIPLHEPIIMGTGVVVVIGGFAVLALITYFRQWGYLSDLLRDRLVDLEAGLHEDQVRALPLGGHGRHGGPHAELAGFVAGCSHDAALTGSADGNRLAAEIRIVPLFDRRVEGVHIDVDDLALAAFVHRTMGE